VVVGPIVFLNYQYGAEDVRGRLLDLAYIDGRPVAVLAWVAINGSPRTPSRFVTLEPQLLRPSNRGIFWYDGVIADESSSDVRSASSPQGL
jgi:hypothetical protein